MKKIIWLTILCLYFTITKNVFALEFIKSSSNPLPITYDFGYQSLLQANIYKDENIYRGILTAKKSPTDKYSLVLIESLDGLSFSLTKEIIASDKDISNPRLFIDETGTKILYAQKEAPDFYKIYSKNCNNEFACDSPQLLLDPDINNLNENHGHFAPFVKKINDLYYLFYGSWGNSGFNTYLAHSDHFGDWQKCPNFALPGLDGAFIDIDDINVNMYAHQSNSTGIQKLTALLPLTCDSVFTNHGYIITPSTAYDQRHVIFPSIINNENGQLLYYTGLGNDNVWRLNLATNTIISSSPTPTIIQFPKVTPTSPVIVTPTATILPTNTPSPTPKIPIIILPGFLASWNKEAILHNQTVDYSAWKLQNFVKEYDGIINTLKNIGYQENINLFLFPYDWRQSIEKTTVDFNSYLQTKIWNDEPNQKINIVGHSLGGLVGRIFAQKNKDKINRIISVGSPHFGAVQFYKPLEAGEIDRSNTFLWLAEKIVLIVNKSALESDRITIVNKFPATKDMFPTFNFLKDTTGNEVSINNLTIKNSFLPAYNQTFSEIFPLFTAIFGEKDKNTLAGFIVEPQNSLDQLLGNYQDGKPTESYSDLGDYLILSKSASQDTDSEKFYFDHGEIITKKEAIKKILGLLNINFNDDQIVEGYITKISSSLIFMIKSPATMAVEHNDSVYAENEGIIFIPDAQSGSYSLKVQGTGQGKYEVVIGQISENNDIWESINGEITESPASSQIDDYNIVYDNQTAFSIFPTPTSAAEVLTKEAPTLTPTVTLVPTSTPSPTSSTSTSSTIASSNNGIPISRESAPSVLGISSSQEELITPTVEATKQLVIKKEIKKSPNIWDYIWPSITTLILGGIGYLFRKKFLEK